MWSQIVRRTQTGRLARAVPAGCSRQFSAAAAGAPQRRRKNKRQQQRGGNKRAPPADAFTDKFTVIDEMDEVYGMESFDTSSLRQAPGASLDPRTFDEFRQPQPDLLSLAERKHQCLDPHDYLLEGVEFYPVDRSQYVLPAVSESPHSHTEASSVGKYFPLNELKEGISKGLEPELDVTEDRLLMVREPAVKVIASLQAFVDGDYKNGPDPLVLLSGPRSSGKSATLAHVVDYARSNGWVTLFVPRMHSILHDSDVMEPSRRRPGFFDQPTFAREILSQFGAANQDLLSAIELKTKDHPEAEGRLDNYSTLAEVVAESSNADPQIDHVGLVLDLVRELSVTTEFPVLLALDDYNQCYQSTAYYYDNERIWPEQLTLVNALRFFQQTSDDEEHAFAPKHPLQNGVVVAAESHHRSLDKSDNAKYRAVWKSITATASRVPHSYFNISEVESCLRHYFHHNICFQEPTESAVRTLHLLTNGNPSEMLLRSTNPANFVVETHLPGGQPGGRHNQWKNPR